jgi:alpha-glucosidase
VVPGWTQAPPSTAGYHPEAVELHLFVPTEDGEHVSFLQEDDGLTFAMRDGAFVRTTVTVTRRGAEVTLRATVDGDGFPELRRTAFHLVVHGAAVDEIELDGSRVAATGDHVVLPNTAGPFTVRLTV